MGRDMTAGRDTGRPSARPPAGGRQRALVVTDDADLLEGVLSVAAAIGIAPEVAVDLVGARARWLSAPAVLLDADLAAVAGWPALVARPPLVLVCRDWPDQTLWALAARIGARAVLALVEPDADPDVAALRPPRSAMPEDDWWEVADPLSARG